MTDINQVINQSMRDSVTSILECYWSEEFLAEVSKYKAKKPNEWARTLYLEHLKEENNGKAQFFIDAGPVLEFIEPVANAALKQVDWATITQHAEKLLQRKK